MSSTGYCQMKNRSSQNFLAHVRSSLEKHKRITASEWEARPAAVLLPLFQHNDDWNLLYTRRTESVDSHRGQVSFPGGAIEGIDNGPIEAALRELEEEIGIGGDEVEILGCADNIWTISQFAVTPVVGRIPWPISLDLNEAEVARVFGVPLSWLVDAENLETELRDIPELGLKVPVYYYKHYDGELIWGATAQITLNFLEIIGLKGK